MWILQFKYLEFSKDLDSCVHKKRRFSIATYTSKSSPGSSLTTACMVHRMNIARNRIHLNILPLVSCELNPVRYLHPRSRNASLIQDLQTSLSAGQTSHLCR
ncbi:hypothetical protein HPB50_019599 [Hyalomma asiaticum]|uniref:Uncharacterized protein n=1 Tax=Hyalomma asiaticum TaxID=266040 RepID=A0ACB7TMY5_HYAAI|nr:hypothetical protein HPB50_019599 [Hyalomma asiaticum]